MNPHDWASQEYVNDWLDRVSRREADRAAVFDLICNLLSFEADAAFRFIDLGTGSGYLARFILERFPNSQALGLDGSAAMLAHARETLRPFGRRVRLVEADFGQADWIERLGDERFDAAVASKAIHNLFDPQAVQRVYSQVHQVLADGGIFLSFDNLNAVQPLSDHFEAANDARKAQRATALGEAGEERDRAHSHQHRAAGAPRSTLHAPRSTPHQRPDYGGALEDHLRWLSEAGFRAVDCAWRQLFNVLLIARK